MRRLSFRTLLAIVVVCAQFALTAPQANASTLLFSDKFTGASGAPNSTRWKYWWGTAKIHNDVMSLASATPTSTSKTYSALLTTRKAWTNYSFSYIQRNVSQLRTGSHPNTWEVAWAMFRYRDLHDYYYFILKPNGWEVGKKQGSDDQIFLRTGTSPHARMGYTDAVKIIVNGSTITVWGNGAKVTSFSDRGGISSGAIGLYEEDSHVHFDNTVVYSV